jgi:phosphoglycolate phosphatase
MQFKAILFDLDGTLLDSLEDLGNAVNRLLAERGFPTHDLDRYRYFVGDGAMMLITRALPKQKRKNDVIQACVDEFQKDYSQNWNVKTRLYDGIAEMLDELTALKLKLAVLSNKPHKFTKQCVDAFLSNWGFKIVLGQRDEVPRKPSPEGALEIAEHLNTKPENILYLGDSGVDMQTAVAAGMFPAGVLWGFRSGKELKDAGAKALLERPLEILSLLS